MIRLPERIRALRKAQKWTQIKVAEKVNVSAQVVSNWERGYSFPDHEDIRRLSEIFNTSSDYILGNTDNPLSPMTVIEDKDLQPFIQLDNLSNYQLNYKGYTLTEEETKDLTILLETALKRWKK